MTSAQKNNSENGILLFWFRRDLRLEDNVGLFQALNHSQRVQCVFVFDTDILKQLQNPQDRRVTFIYNQLEALNKLLKDKARSELWIFQGRPQDIFSDLIQRHPIAGIFANHDYEPYARSRDESIRRLCSAQGLIFKTFKDQVIFEKEEVLTDQGRPYSVYTPYKKKWLAQCQPGHLRSVSIENHINHFNLNLQNSKPAPSSNSKSLKYWVNIEALGFERVKVQYPPDQVSSALLKKYQSTRDFPELADGTSHLGIHFRFGTISVREWAREAQKFSQVWLSELIWREFFMQILWHYPEVEKKSFRPEYEDIRWRNNPEEFELWKQGQTGYPLVDAGMRELLATGHMHNRVRMVVASFLCKHLLTHWYRGERYFASQLLDYDLAANNGNWQWAAGTGCDAAPYFRVFNPTAQAEKFDPQNRYIRQWVPEFESPKYARPLIDHAEGRTRALFEYQRAVKKT